jgi:DNA-directed RNA polymerase alpha subunit
MIVGNWTESWIWNHLHKLSVQTLLSQFKKQTVRSIAEILYDHADCSFDGVCRPSPEEEEEEEEKKNDVLEMPAAGTVVMVYNRNCDRADHACMSTRAAS